MLHFLGFLFIGALVGWLAGRIMHSKGGLLKNILVGIIGSELGGWLGSLIGVEPTSFIAGVLLSVAGACLLIWLVRKLFK